MHTSNSLLRALKAMAIMVIMACMTALPQPVRAQGVNLQQLVRQVEEQYNGDSSHITATMHIVTRQWERSITLEGWSLGRELCLTRILEPAKEKGVSTLKADKQVWNYLPKVDRVIKIPPSMMGAPWMGSHITNEDLVKSSHVDLDYALTLEEETADFWRIACTPKTDAAVVWGRIVYTILKDHTIPRDIAYYDDAMVKVRTIRFEDVQHVGDHVLPLRMIVQPSEMPDEQTILQYRTITFDLPLEESFFSLRTLKGK